MRDSDYAKLFHVLVVCGGAAVGCGGRSIPGTTEGEGSSDEPANARSGGAPSGVRGGASAAAGGTASTLPVSGGAPAVGDPAGGRPASSTGAAGTTSVIVDPSDCPRPGELTCDDYGSRTGCWCNPEAVVASSECDAPWEIQCAALLPASNDADILTFERVPVGCVCDPQAISPYDCEEIHHFTCDEYAPVYVNCSCVPWARPPGAEVCCISEPVADGGFVEFGCSYCLAIR